MPTTSTKEPRPHYHYPACLLIYSLLWFAGSVFLYLFYRAQGRDMLWVLDGLYQHFPSFSYVCDITESVLRGSGNLTGILPFNYTIGQGTDLFMVLNSYDFADPISWLCAALLFMTRVHRYSLMVFGKLWFTGIAFSVYCFICGQRNRPAILCGALTYTFSSNILLMFAMHPNFVNWAYFLPLLLGGYELYRRNGKKGLLLLTVFFNLLVSFYTFYINAVLLVIYVVCRSLTAWSQDRSLKTFVDELCTDLRAAFICLAGALLCAFSLLPTLYAYTQNPRIGGLNGYTDSMLHYGKAFYKHALAALFCTNIEADYTTVIGLFSIALPAVIFFCLFQAEDRSGLNRSFRLFGAVQLLMLGIPMAGRIMNGMGYASNRWTYAFAFTASFMFTESFAGLCKCSLKRRLVIALSCLPYVLLCWFMKDLPGKQYVDISLLALLVVLVLYLISGAADRRKSGGRMSAGVLTAITIMCMFFQIYHIFAPGKGNYVSEFEKAEEHDYNISDSSRPLSGLSREQDFFRVESKEITTNVDGLNGVFSTDAWWSMYPHTMYDYLNAFESNAILQNCNFFGIGNRTALLELAAVRYYTSPVKVFSLTPYGFEHSPSLSDSLYNVYENKLALPVGYSFDSFIRRDTFDALGPVQKQEALLQGVVLDPGACEELPAQIKETAVHAGAYELDYEITELHDLTLTDDTMTAESEDASMEFYADIPENAEIYLQIEGIRLVDPDACSLNVVRFTDDPKARESRIGKISNLSSKWPVERNGITFDLGIGRSGRTRFLLRDTMKSQFTYDSIILWAVPMDSYESQVTQLRNNSLTNICVNGKQISGTVDFSESRILQIAIPYSIGWSARIDGQKADVMNSDLLYMALVIPEGRHDIVLQYRTPYLREGAAVSLLTLLLLAAISIRSRLRNRAV